MRVNSKISKNSNFYQIVQKISRILKSQSDYRTKENGVRQGYMGHLINIANNIVTQCEKSNILASFLKNNLSPECLSKWENLVNTQLVEINKVHQTVMMVYVNIIYIFYIVNIIL